MEPEAESTAQATRGRAFLVGLLLGLLGAVGTVTLFFTAHGDLGWLHLAPLAVSAAAALYTALAWRRFSLVVGFVLMPIAVTMALAYWFIHTWEYRS